MSALTSNLGYPRIGDDRELKFALEGYWSGKRSADELETVAKTIRQKNWQTQKDAGIDLIPSNDFSLYDHVLDTTCLVGAIPKRFDHPGGEVSLETYFALARGRDAVQDTCSCTHEAVSGVVAQNLRKWFDTNYHYLVPEFHRDQQFQLSSDKPFREFREALEQNILTKPVLLGPVSYLLLGQCDGKAFDRLDLLDRLVPVYAEILQKLRAEGAEWVQLDEPTLVLDLDRRQQQAFSSCYERLRQGAPDLKLLLGTYFGPLRENLPLALSLPVDAVHIDAVSSPIEPLTAIDHIDNKKLLSVGVVDGRNIWKNDLQQSLDLLDELAVQIGRDRLIIAPSSSLLHVPTSVERERAIDPVIHSWLAFAREKLKEVVLLQAALDPESSAFSGALSACGERHAELTKRLSDPRVDLFAELTRRMRTRRTPERTPRRAPFQERKEAQADALHLPPLPTTTIGSFPQTQEIRRARSAVQKGTLSSKEYDTFLRSEIAKNIGEQEKIGLDVLVHGEPERNDMVQYFAEKLKGVATTEHGWVQSFGSRCVRPPIIYGEVSRPSPITVEWATYAQSLTEKPVKGMLTGPVTMLNWSFVRDDIPRASTCQQIAKAIRDEVQDLERAGIRIIQIDEPALREGLPLRKDEQSRYWHWATDAFRSTIAATKPETQIHTHTCYGDVRELLPLLKSLDVDVITIEAARSRLAFLDALGPKKLACDIGPGVWDIHSPRVPSTQELVELIQRAREHIPDDRLWINPDCGLKTRKPEEVWESLRHLVEAAHIVRASLPNHA